MLAHNTSKIFVLYLNQSGRKGHIQVRVSQQYHHIGTQFRFLLRLARIIKPCDVVMAVPSHKTYLRPEYVVDAELLELALSCLLH